MTSTQIHPAIEQQTEYFRLFADCKITTGHTRATLIDYSRGKMFLISLPIAELIRQAHDFPFADVLSLYDANEQEGIHAVMHFLLENELGHFTAEPQLFPEMEEQFDYPALISNAIIDIDTRNPELGIILPQLTELGCYDVQMRIFSVREPNELYEWLVEAEKHGLKSIELMVHHSPKITKKFLRDLADRFFIVKNLIVHSAPKDEAYIIYPDRLRNNMGNIVFVEQPITHASHCGFVSPKYFVYDSTTFRSEARSHNTCLNRKIGIDAMGYIRNCPAMPLSFGHITDTPLLNAVSGPKFQEAWNIHKDQINTCKSCEFRYACLDCRAFTQSGGILDKPLKCGYDPFTGTWENVNQENLLIPKL